VSDDKSDKNPATSATAATKAPASAAPVDAKAAEKLTELMAGGDKTKPRSADGAATSSLEANALRAAEDAIAEGERALATARGHLHERSATAAPPRGRGRELAVRILLAINILAMVVVASLPTPGQPTDTREVLPTPPPVVATPPTTEPAPAPTPKLAEPWNRALVEAEARRFPEAIKILEQYLADSPRMAPSQQLNVLMALSHYAFRINDFKKAQDYEQRANAIEHSHSLPEDLVAMAKAAMASGDQETLRRVHARFLLQQKQIPGWLFKHVAEAYLQLGDSYRLQANAAAEKARLQELEATTARLREQAMQGSTPGRGGK
jgi:tetratricopeptide (TPR) repeat protein